MWNVLSFSSIYVFFLNFQSSDDTTVFFCLFYIFRLLCEEKNYDPTFHFEYRGPVIMKGKPTPMDVWFLAQTSRTEIEDHLLGEPV